MKEIQEMKILIIDDNKLSLSLVDSILRKNGYKNIETALSAEEGLKRAESNPPDLILLDIIMPGMNGYEFCQEIRSSKTSKHIPIIMMTGRAEDEDESLQKGFESGATDFITKSKKSIVLLARVKSALFMKRTYDQLEEEIKKREQKEKEIKHVLKELKKTQSYLLLREKMASIGQLAAGIAHEINNPTGFVHSNLGSLNKYSIRLINFLKKYEEGFNHFKINSDRDISSFCEEIEELKKKLKIDFIIKDFQKVITDSLEGTERIKRIVADLKNFSRIDQTEFKYASINEGLESTLNVVWNDLKNKCTVKKDYGELPLIYCNLGQLNQVFMNLLVNAAYAINEKGTIKIITRYINDQTGRNQDYIEIKISDSGQGIPEDKLNRIFEPFFTTKPVGKGAGLGLSIAYDIIKKHRGEITVESELGKGTTFTIKLPRLEEKQEG